MKVAIVGGGPSGLSAAYFLTKLGYSTTVFESSGKLGGMMQWAIPKYRLPHNILDNDIKNILDMGVNVRLGCTVCKDIPFSELAEKYDAVYLAVGAQLDQKLGMEGENLPGMMAGLKFLRDVNDGTNPHIGDSIVIIGGGNVAVDVARTAKRLGCEKVTMCYRREKEDMPAYAEECDAAWEEGINFHFLVAPEKIIQRDGRAVGVVFKKMDIGAYDKWGRRTPIATEQTIEIMADTIVTAIGQVVDKSFIDNIGPEFATNKGTIKADKYNQGTANPKVYAGGDAATGPASVIDAIAQGKNAARSIDKMLSGEDRFIALKKKSKIKYSMKLPDNERKMVRQKPSELLARERVCGFDEVVQCMDVQCAKKEAERCFRCDIMSKEARE